MPKVSLRLPDDLYEAIVHHGEATGQNVSDTIRDILLEWRTPAERPHTTPTIQAPLQEPQSGTLSPGGTVRHTTKVHDGSQLFRANCGLHIASGDGYCPVCQR